MLSSVELYLIGRKVIYVFKGYLIFKENMSWTHIKEIPSTRLLVSLHHSSSKLANMEVFDISNQAHIRRVYSFEEIHGRNTQFVSCAFLIQ